MDLHAKVTTAGAPGHVDLEPDLDAVLQAEAPMSAMPVRATGVTRVKELPNDDRTGVTYPTITATTYRQILTADPYRALATVQSFDNDIYLAYGRNPTVGDPNAQRVAKGTLVTITARVAVSVCAYTGTTAVAVAQERLAHSE
jgi:hypothetical protein